MTSELVATALWPTTTELITALDERFGTPVDCYVNGTQSWLTPDGPNEYTLEWRLHPIGGYLTPVGISHYEVLETVIAAISVGADVHAIQLGDETRSITSLWSGLECFGAYGDPITPDELVAHASQTLGIAPLHHGLVDHQQIGDRWEQSQRKVSLFDLVANALDASGEAQGSTPSNAQNNQ